MTDYPDFEGGKVRLLTERQWAEFEGLAVTIANSGGAKTFGQSVVATRLVDADKTLYLTSVAIVIVATNAADADNNQFGYMDIRSPDVVTWHGKAGFNGGIYIELDQPIKVAGGKDVYIYGFSYANHDVDIAVFARGYEI